MPSIRTDHLVSAIENCDQRLRVFRDKYRERVKKYVGRNYSNDGWSNPRPDNGIAMQVNILRRFLVSSNPRILAIPTVPSLASEAASLAESVNARAEAIRLGDTLDMGIVTALLFGMSVTKTCYVPEGYGQPGSPSGVHVDCVDPDDLVLDLSARKIDYLVDLALHFDNGKLHVKDWESMDDEAIIAELVDIRGIGRWTAEMFLIFYLQRPNVLPLDDPGLITGISQNYFSGEQVSRSDAREVAEAWKPWCSVATWYIWRSLDPAPTAD